METLGIVICKPKPNGASSPPEYYVYGGSLSTLRRAHLETIPKYVAIDDHPLPNRYELPYVYGHLLEFRQIGVGLRRWVVFAKNGKLYLDNGQVHELNRDIEISIGLRLWFCFTHIKIDFRETQMAENFWVYTPISRLVFRDPVGTKDASEPLINTLSLLATSVGYDTLLLRWTSGIEHESTALKVIEF